MSIKQKYLKDENGEIFSPVVSADSVIVGGGVSLTESFSYSTEEIKTGKFWIDGSPIYRKTYTGHTPNKNTSKWTNLQKAYLENTTILNIYGVIANTKTDRRVIPVNAYESTNYYVSVSYLGDSDFLQIYTVGWTYTTFGFDYSITIEYIKN